MKKTLKIWFVVALILVGGLTLIGYLLKNKNGNYYNLEAKLVESAEVYYGQYPDQLPADSVTITSSKLINTNFLDNMNIEGDECTGYVIVEKNYMFYKYYGFIKCKNYETKKYDVSQNPQENAQ